MLIVAETELFTYYQVEVSVFRNRYRYYFEFIDNNDESLNIMKEVLLIRILNIMI